MTSNHTKSVLDHSCWDLCSAAEGALASFDIAALNLIAEMVCRVWKRLMLMIASSHESWRSELSVCYQILRKGLLDQNRMVLMHPWFFDDSFRMTYFFMMAPVVRFPLRFHLWGISSRDSISSP